MSKHILVTGGNSGIGLALCKLLVKDYPCHVYLGSRNELKGATAMKTIMEACPDKTDKIEFVQIDVSDDASCKVEEVYKYGRSSAKSSLV